MVIINLNPTNWNIEEMTGYKPITTFYQDLSIADNFGANAVRDTYKKVFAEWEKNTEYFTEFVMALNWKISEHYNAKRLALAKTYDELWREADRYVMDNWKGERLNYYLRTTD